MPADKVSLEQIKQVLDKYMSKDSYTLIDCPNFFDCEQMSTCPECLMKEFEKVVCNG